MQYQAACFDSCISGSASRNQHVPDRHLLRDRFNKGHGGTGKGHGGILAARWMLQVSVGTLVLEYSFLHFISINLVLRFRKTCNGSNFFAGHTLAHNPPSVTLLQQCQHVEPGTIFCLCFVVHFGRSVHGNVRSMASMYSAF